MATRTFPGRFASLAAIRDFVGKFAAQAGLSPKSVYEVQLAVDEACSNIIEHGYGERKEGEIECTCVVGPSGLTLILRDWAPPFIPGVIEPPDLSIPLKDLKTRGAGMVLMQQMMDLVSYEVVPGEGNRLTLVKNK